MNPVEAAIRAACREMAVDPDNADGGWRNFLALGLACAHAFVDALPPELSELVRPHMETPS